MTNKIMKKVYAIEFHSSKRISDLNKNICLGFYSITRAHQVLIRSKGTRENVVYLIFTPISNFFVT